jgi:hypothetical protein
MNQPDREALARAVDILASAPKASIRLFLLLLNRNVRLADAIDIVHEYDQGSGEEEDSWGLGPSVTQRNEPSKRGRPKKQNPNQES